MPWCPVCDKVREIYPDTRGDSVAVPTTSERYNRYGEYIGYDEGESFRTRIRTIPRCRICNTVFELPNATSKEQYFNAKKEITIRSWRKGKPSAPGHPLWAWLGTAILVILVICGVAILIDFIAGNVWLATFVGIAAGIGFGVFLGNPSKESNREKEEYKAQLQAWSSKLEELQSMECSDANYERLKNGVIFRKRELSKEDRRLQNVFRDIGPMEQIHRRRKR